MKKLIALTIPIALSACVGMGETEKTALKEAAIEAARNQSKEVHLAYLQCYPLRDIDKKDCKRKAKKLTTDRQHAVTWDYILPFDYEVERLGFKAFLRDQGKPCAGVNQGPQYNEERQGYVVQCTDGGSYVMAYDRGKGAWRLMP